MKNGIIILLATVLGYIGGGATIYLIMKDKYAKQEQTDLNVVKNQSNQPSVFGDNSTDPAKNPLNNETISSIKFEKNTHDFGNINEGDVIHTTFEFVNNSKRNLVINNCLGSCGCTVPEWPKGTIAPGAKGTIDVEFNSAGKKDAQMKTITVYANTDPPATVLYIKANVKAK